HWQRTMQGHAAANMLPVIASNRIGVEVFEESELTFYGSSFIADETGGLVAEADDTTSQALTARFDLDEVQERRKGWGLFRDRRPDLYPSILGYDGSD
ncbi:MAG: N-carbamoylputrescine amidase, partial [Parvibaculaceae bacterium]|nr:N-carbamoylputrescine amidase [Parvibaculaceae bacterium]